MSYTLMDILHQKRYNTDKHTVHRYIQQFYDEEFTPYRDKVTNLLEIGVLHGESLKLWRDYFQQGQIVGIDIFKRVPLSTVQSNLQHLDIALHVVDSFQQGDEAESTRAEFNQIYGDSKFDIIIDDGLHTEQSQFDTFHNFKHLVNPGGLYVIEDVRANSVDKLSQIPNIEFKLLPEGPNSPVKFQYIAVIRF